MHNPYYLFFASVLVFIGLFGLGRQMMMEAIKAAKTAKIRHEEFNY